MKNLNYNFGFSVPTFSHYPPPLKNFHQSSRAKEVTKMKILILFLLSIILLPIQFSYSQIYQNWVIRYNGNGNYNDLPNSIFQKGNDIYITGTALENNVLTYTASFKYDYCGRINWSNFYYYGIGSWGHTINVDNNDNIFTFGTVFSYYPGNSAFSTRKFNNSGTFLWERINTTPYPGCQNCESMAWQSILDNNQNIILIGETSQSNNQSGIRDFYILKYNNNGDYQWQKGYNGPGNGFDYPEAVTTDNEGNIYVVGGSEGNGTDFDFVTLKYGPGGVLLWVSRYNGEANSMDIAFDIAVDDLGNVYVTGVSREYEFPQEGWEIDYSLPFGNRYNEFLKSEDIPQGQNSFTAIKYNSSGQQQWVKKFFGNGSTRNASGSKIILDGDNQIYLTGASISRGSSTNWDFTTIKYNPNGSVLWISNFDGPGTGENHDQDYVSDIKKDNSGNIYVTGRSKKNNSVIGSDYDYATVKYNSSGVQQWVVRYNHTSDLHDENTEQVSALSVVSNNVLYVTGRSLQAASFYGSDYDYATIRYSNHWLTCDLEDNSNFFGLNDIETLNQDTGFSVGDNGRIKWTKDKGINWTELNSGSNENLIGIKFFNANKGIIIGENSTVLITSDGGVNWNRKNLNSENELRTVSILNENTAFVTAANGKIYNTSDAGNSWASLNTGTNETIAFVKFISSNSGVAVTVSGKILKTNNGGNSWNTLSNLSNIGVNRVVFYNQNLGAVAGNNGKIFVTSNGGTNWKNCSLGSNIKLNDIYFRNENFVYVCGENGAIFCSTNKGDSWEEQPTLIEDEIKSISFFSDNNGVAVTEDGKILLTSIGEIGGNSGFDNITSNIVAPESLTTHEDIIVHNNYPNPFNPETRISFALKERQHVVIKVYDVLGREIKTLLNNVIDGGSHNIKFKADNLSSGIYYYTIKTNSGLITKQMLLLK
jgi:photosystem II stability/assembly factor-like uncharacterized protein